jgi:membrane protease YdiL (CAAX protease family)
MSAMVKTSGGFRATVLAGWVLLSVIGLGFARFKGIPSWAALPALAAFLIVYPFYLVPAFRSVREDLAGHRLPFYLVASAVLPFLAASMGAIHFTWVGLLKLLALALVPWLWYRVLPVMPPVDIGFLALVAAVKLSGFLEPVYLSNYKGLEIARLGDLALFQTAVMVLMLERRVPETGYWFLPARRDWGIGALHYLYYLPVGFGLALGLRAVRLVPPHDIGKVAASFLVWLWVLTLAEEFIFRGVLQQWMEDWTRNRQVALILTSIVFGAVHLWFGKQFPNWKWMIVAGALGWFCGRARNQAGNIQASMVTHTLVIATWRLFFV